MNSETTMTFTPGPWRLGAGSGSVVCDAIGNEVWSDPENVAFYGGSLIAESIRHRPNATLIAAAPELLKACQHVITHSPHRSFSCANKSEFDATCSRCAAEWAIAKALSGGNHPASQSTAAEKPSGSGESDQGRNAAGVVVSPVAPFCED
jgi:hypothetical protein